MRSTYGDGTNTYVWDRANRLLSMGGVSYAYDGLNNRVSQTISSMATQYLLDLQPGLSVVLAVTTGANTDRYIHGPRGIHAQHDAADNWEWMVQDGLGSVRGVADNTGTVQWSGSYADYGAPYDEVGTPQTMYGFTGELTNETGLVHLRARDYNPALGIFTALDPFEGMAQRPMSLNGYSYTNGNPINLVDPSGLYTCNSEAVNIQTACDELDQALQRAGRSSLIWQSISDTVQDGMVLLRNLETAAEQAFGARLTIRLPGSVLDQAGLNINVDECSTAPNIDVGPGNALELTKQSILRAVAAMVHIAARFAETSIPVAAVSQWLSRDTIEFLSDTVGITSAYTGYVQLDPPNNIINLGSQVSVGTIVHELGHSFDRAYSLRASSPMRGLFLLRDSGRPTYDNTAPGYPNSTQNGNGMIARANPSPDQAEVWSDMFMTWVLHGQGKEAIAGSGQIIGWDSSLRRDAKFKEIYTWLTVRRLSTGIGGPPAASATQEEKLDWVRYVSNLAFGYSGDSGGDY